MKIVVKFEAERATKNTVRYTEIVEDGMPVRIGTVYVQNDTLKELGAPRRIKITLEPDTAA